MSSTDIHRDDLGHLLIQTSADIDAMPWEPLGSPGMEGKVLWRSGDVVLGLMRVAPGHEMEPHTHLGAHHHILMTQGSCRMMGREVSTGAYVYIPPGVAHGVSDVSADGCTFFYTYRPVEVPSVESSPLDSTHGTPV